MDFIWHCWKEKAEQMPIAPRFQKKNIHHEIRSNGQKIQKIQQKAGRLAARAIYDRYSS